jgi:hypothetical protein
LVGLQRNSSEERKASIVPTKKLNVILDQLDKVKNQFGPAKTRLTLNLLKQVTRLKVDDAESLIRLHELLLFLCAYPHSRQTLSLANTILRTFQSRLARLQKADLDLSSLEHPELSGIVGMPVIDTFSYRIVQWLNDCHPRKIDFYWQWFEDENRLAESWPRFMPLLEEDAFVEANVPYHRWLTIARGRQSETAWLLDRYKHLPLIDALKAQLYGARGLYVRWSFAYRDSRSGLRCPVRKLFYHSGPLIQRREVSLIEELNKAGPRLQKLSNAKGREAIHLARTASTVRYRELYGFTNGDSKVVCEASLGRGVDLLVIALPPESRLPLRAYHAAMIYKNGVPIGYFEGLSLFERMESGFNLYYTFREGETAWLYAQVLRTMKHLTGVTAFTLDPYQIGFENEEGIASGAFWFYRKLGFRSMDQSIEDLTKGEEQQIATRKNYRTSSATLRRLAVAPMIFELVQKRKGDWDRFQIRSVGFAVQRITAKKFGGDAAKMCASALDSMANVLGVDHQSFSDAERKIFADFGAVLLLIPEFKSWSDDDKESLKRIIEAKAGDEERRYLNLMQQHERLRAAMIGLGTIYYLAYNGANIAAVLALTYKSGFGNDLVTFMVGHGVIELSCIFIAGGAGLLIGSAMLMPGDLSRADALKTRGMEAVRLMIGVALLLVVAGMIEGFISPAPIDPSIKYSIGGITGLALYSYLLFVGR